MSVTIPIPNCTAIYDHGMIQQSAFPFRNGFQTFHEMSKQRHMITIDLSQRLHLLGIVAVMGQTVVSAFHANHRIAPVRSIVRHEIGNYAR